MKTIKEWASLCADETIRQQWIKNAETQNWSNIMCKSMDYALFYAFSWGFSPQGYDYWERIRNDMEINPKRYLKKRKAMFHEYENN